MNLSVTSRVTVRIYHTEVSVAETTEETFRFDLSGDSVRLTNFSWSKQMGQPAGVFNLTFKGGDPDLDTIMNKLEDNDWVDISIWEDGHEVHVVRGLIDSIQFYRTASTSSILSHWQITGRDFGKIFVDQAFWFDPVTGSNTFLIQQALTTAATDRVNPKPHEVIAQYLLGFLVPGSAAATGLWYVPKYFREKTTSRTNFVWSVVVDGTGFIDYPERRYGMNAFEANSSYANLWEMANGWSDPQMCELYTELRTLDEKPLKRGMEILPSQTKMFVNFRTKPWFSNSGDGAFIDAELNNPVLYLSEHEIDEMTLVKAGQSCRNSFGFKGNANTFAAAATDLVIPQVDQASIGKRGIRHHYSETKYYVAPESSNLVPTGSGSVATEYRDIQRDWHCYDHKFYTGTIRLNRSVAAAQIGQHILVLDKENNAILYAYLVGVQQSWSYENGVITTLSIVRGYRGPKHEYVDAVSDYSQRFALLDSAQADLESLETEVTSAIHAQSRGIFE